MDPVTHGLLGAAVGQAFYARRLGWRRAVTWGAMGAMLPDVDVLAVPFGGPLGEWRFHRAATHAIWLVPLVGVALGEGARRLTAWRDARAGRASPQASRATWLGLLTLSLLSHPLLDLMTTWGIQLLWPSRARFALDAVPIVDVFYTGLLLLAALVGRWSSGARPALARRVAAAALAASTAYLGYGYLLNAHAAVEARRQLARDGWGQARVDAYPTLLQPWLRRVVARQGGQVRVGLLSLWRPHRIAWGRFAEPPPEALAALRDSADVDLFVWFAMGQVTWRLAEQHGVRTVEIEDLRFGYGEVPDQGLWGVRLTLGPDGPGPVRRFDRRPPALDAALLRLWAATFHPQG